MISLDAFNLPQRMVQPFFLLHKQGNPRLGSHMILPILQQRMLRLTESLPRTA